MATSKSDDTNQVIPQDVERIRDIIFGPQMRNYEQQFQTLQRDIERLQQTVDDLNEQLAEQHSSHNKAQQTLRREMRQADDGLRDELRQATQALTHDKVDRLSLADSFIELGNQLKTGGTLGNLLQTLTEVTEKK